MDLRNGYDKHDEKSGGASVLTNGASEALGKEGDVSDKKEQRTRTLSQYATEVFFGLLFALWGYLLGGCALPFGAVPFGAALLCAARRRVPYIYAGLCVASLGMAHPLMRVVSYSVALGLRLTVSLFIDRQGKRDKRQGFFETFENMFSEKLNLRMATSCVAVFVMGAYLLIEGGFLYYDLYGALLSLIVAPAACALFAGVFERSAEGQKRELYSTVGFIALSCALVYASRYLRVMGVSASAFGAMFASLYLTRRRGTVSGVLAGALCGLCYSPELAPLFAFGALCGGIVLPVSVTLASTLTFTVSTAWALYVRGIGAFNGLLPAILFSTVIFGVCDKLFFTREAEKAKSDTRAEASETERETACVPLPPDALDGVRLEDTEGRVKTVCESFSALASVFEAMGELQKRPSAEDLRRICDNAFDSSCTGCASKDLCWDEKYRATDSQIALLCESLYRDGSVCRADVGDELAERCARLPDILDEINHNASEHASRILQYDKTEIFATDYASVADIIAEAMAKECEEYEYDSVLSERLCAKLSESIDGILGVAAWGKRKKRIMLSSEHRADIENALDEVLEIVGGVCSKSFRVERSEERERGGFVMILCERSRLCVSCAKRTLRADGEDEYCGDTVGLFRNSEDRFYSFISDGMGAGRDAAVTSGICALFLQKMLGAGNGCEATLRMLNGFLRNKGSGSLHECSATVDLMELDLLCGRASFYKSGAAPTYVLRDGGLLKLRSKTLPVGILRQLDTKRIGFDVGAGDVIVMVSDGVTQGREECPWLYDLLRTNIEREGIEKTADLIVKYAKNEGSADDLSVLIVKLENE